MLQENSWWSWDAKDLQLLRKEVRTARGSWNALPRPKLKNLFPQLLEVLPAKKSTVSLWGKLYLTYVTLSHTPTLVTTFIEGWLSLTVTQDNCERLYWVQSTQWDAANPSLCPILYLSLPPQAFCPYQTSCMSVSIPEFASQGTLTAAGLLSEAEMIPVWVLQGVSWKARERSYRVMCLTLGFQRWFSCCWLQNLSFDYGRVEEQIIASEGLRHQEKPDIRGAWSALAHFI